MSVAFRQLLLLRPVFVEPSQRVNNVTLNKKVAPIDLHGSQQILRGHAYAALEELSLALLLRRIAFARYN